MQRNMFGNVDILGHHAEDTVTTHNLMLLDKKFLQSSLQLLQLAVVHWPLYSPYHLICYLLYCNIPQTLCT